MFTAFLGHGSVFEGVDERDSCLTALRVSFTAQPSLQHSHFHRPLYPTTKNKKSEVLICWILIRRRKTSDARAITRHLAPADWLPWQALLQFCHGPWRYMVWDIGPFGQLGSAVPAASPPSLLPTPLAAGTAWDRGSLGTVRAQLSNSENTGALSMLV